MKENSQGRRNPRGVEGQSNEAGKSLGYSACEGFRRCSHVYAHVIRTRHPLPSSARGVHMCKRPSSVKYV